MAEPRPGIVLDSSAVIALLLDESGAGTVEMLLRSSDARMSTVNAAEVVDVLIRVHRGDPDEVSARIDELLSSVIRPIEASLEFATRAGEIRGRLYDRRTRRLSIADCFVLATAEPGDRIATTDATLAEIARDEGIAVVALDLDLRPALS